MRPCFESVLRLMRDGEMQFKLSYFSIFELVAVATEKWFWGEYYSV